MGGRSKKRLRERLSYDLTWASLDDKQKNSLIKLAEQGKPVSLVIDEPEIPSDCIAIYTAYMELRNSTKGDQPVSFSDKLLAWKIYGDVDLQMFIRFISSLDHEFLSHATKTTEQKRIEASKRRNQERNQKRTKSVSKPKLPRRGPVTI